MDFFKDVDFPQIKINPPKLPKINLLKLKLPKNPVFWAILASFLISSTVGFIAGGLAGGSFFLSLKDYLQKIKIERPGEKVQEEVVPEYIPQTSQEEQIIDVVKMASPAVVSVAATKDIPVIEQYYYNPLEEFFGPGSGFFSPFEFGIPQYRERGTEKQEVSAGTGFIVSGDGLILTNKHVVSVEKADYTVLTNDGQKYAARVLARDPFQDLAILKIQAGLDLAKEGNVSKEILPVLALGNSDSLQIGQTVIAIGNALGEFRNTVSVGVISGLSRSIVATGGGISEAIEDVIQTDAAINPGNSGGPLLNLKGEVVGVSVAMAAGAQSIGFSIPINKAKKDIEDVKIRGKIVYPFLGIRYILITKAIQEKNNLPYDYGALVLRGESPEELAVTPGSAADKAGIVENDIILEFGGQKITAENTLTKLISKYSSGDKVTLKIWHKEEERTIEVILGERG